MSLRSISSLSFVQYGEEWTHYASFITIIQKPRETVRSLLSSNGERNQSGCLYLLAAGLDGDLLFDDDDAGK